MVLSFRSFVWMQVNHAPGMIEKCPGGISTCIGTHHQVPLGSKLPSYTILSKGEDFKA